MARILLVHGACHGAWCWRDVVPALEARGHEAIALDMPGRAGDTRAPDALTLADHARTILDHAGDGAVLAGHSAGGFSIAAAAEAAPDRVRRLIFVAALLPRDGQSLITSMRNMTARPVGAGIARTDEGRRYVFDTATAGPALYNGVSDNDVAWALSRICAEPGAPHAEKIRLGPAFEGTPKTYIRCLEDHIIPPADQARMAQDLAPEDRHDMTSGHSPFLSRPEELADLIHRAADRA